MDFMAWGRTRRGCPQTHALGGRDRTLGTWGARVHGEMERRPHVFALRAARESLGTAAVDATVVSGG